MTEFLFVRHCESETNRTRHLIGGRSNHSPATERGKRQAALLGAYFRKSNYLPDVVFSSGAVRADTTAAISLSEAGLPRTIHIDERLQELSAGIYEGQPRSTSYTPEIIAQYELNELYGTFPEGESITDVSRRMTAFTEDVHASYPESTLLVFSHGLAIRALTGLLQNHTKQQILETVTDNVSLTEITMNSTGYHIHYVGKNVISE